mmetsp:Transcript_1970/g.3167  ORF Transcript_1970/g.3167 Transcript_1970/m.3167 type:complete len:122 (+) Transcript_1970:641-1006(+)
MISSPELPQLQNDVINNVKDDLYAMVGGPELWSEFLHEMSYSKHFENDIEQADKNLDDLRKQINSGRFEKEINYKYGDTDGVSNAAAEDDSSGSSSDSGRSQDDNVGTFTDSMSLPTQNYS